MAFEKLTNSIHDLDENIRAFVTSSAEYYKLDLYKKIIKGAISLVNMMLIGFVALIALFFLSIAVALSIGQAMGQASAGFYIVGGFYIVIFALIWIFGKKYVEKIIILKSSRTFFND
ncbi:phage holin family protein [Gillisia sp. M10.2A]|uniref:Phage holin family protein n=1 Tax=Gillisia lutea TaxID=2909668 RepID=A0ABS9EGQ0_9FLAO|nr:phage holin family protein [Gillisia lutea]MCF4100636.1 phage holin family protein [Gillisia lutea]